jgi:TonB family protein
MMMMKQIAATVVMLMCGTLVCAQSKPDGEKDKLAGAVHTLRIETMKLWDQYARRQNGPRIPISLTTYDTQGNQAELVSYERNGSVGRRTVTTYDSAGRKTGISTYKEKDKLSAKGVYTLDDKGRVKLVENYDDAGALTSKTAMVYDEAGRLAEQRREEKGEPALTTTFRYDSAGRLVAETTVDSNGETIHKLTQTYAPDVTRLESVLFEHNAVENKTVRINDRKNRKVEMVLLLSDNSAAWKWSFTYDERGNVVGEEFANLAELSKWDYAYEYDAQGNWVKRTKSRWYRVASGKLETVPIEAELRTFTYYPQPYAPKSDAPEADEAGGDFVAGGVLQGEAIRRVEPPYPAAAHMNGISGAVVVEVTVDEAGNVVKAHALSGPGMLKDAAVDAAKQWKFKPTLLSGMPTKVIGTVTFNFNR